MNKRISLKNLFSDSGRTPEENLALFALLNLGILESLHQGLMSASEAVRTFFHAENGLFVHEQLRHHLADEIMSHGVQLPDLFEALPAEEAQREFQQELTKLHILSLNLLGQKLSLHEPQLQLTA